MQGLQTIAQCTLKAALRDRVMYAVCGAALLVVGLVPVLSLFALRQVPQMAMTLAFAFSSLTLLLLTVLLGGFAVWRDVERRYTAGLLGLPLTRSGYLLGKYAGITLVLAAAGIIFFLVSVFMIQLTVTFYPSEQPIAWGNFFIAFSADIGKHILLAACALFFSSVSTSFFLPVFGTIAVFLFGCASQEVMDYVLGPHGQDLPYLLTVILRGLYYVIPNFAAFDFKIEAVYGLPISPMSLLLSGLYFLFYTGLVLTFALFAFKRRELL